MELTTLPKDTVFTSEHECGSASFTFNLGVTGLTRGNLSAHAAKLIEAGYVDETKQIVDRKVLTEYRLTAQGRNAFERYRTQWLKLTSSPKGKRS